MIKIDARGNATCTSLPASHTQVHYNRDGIRIMSAIPVDELRDASAAHPFAFPPPFNRYIVPRDAVLTCTYAEFCTKRVDMQPAHAIHELRIAAETDDTACDECADDAWDYDDDDDDDELSDEIEDDILED